MLNNYSRNPVPVCLHNMCMALIRRPLYFFGQILPVLINIHFIIFLDTLLYHMALYFIVFQLILLIMEAKCLRKIWLKCWTRMLSVRFTLQVNIREAVPGLQWILAIIIAVRALEIAALNSPIWNPPEPGAKRLNI